MKQSREGPCVLCGRSCPPLLFVTPQPVAGLPPSAGLAARRSPSLHYFHSPAGTSDDQLDVAFLGSVAVPDGGRPLRARQDSAIVL